MKIQFEQINNVRDLGGLLTDDGRRIVSGKLIRGSRLSVAGAEDLRKLAGLIDMIVDFRTAREMEEKPDPKLSGIMHYHIPIIELLTVGITREQSSDEEMIRKLLSNRDGALQYMCRMYQMFVTEEHARNQYARFIRLLLTPREKAVYWHCTAGKDRAGIATVLILHLLGVGSELIREDYLQSNKDYLNPEMPRLMGMIEKKLGMKEPGVEKALRILFGAREEYLDALYGKIRELYGDMNAFFEQGLRINSVERDRLRDLYVM